MPVIIPTKDEIININVDVIRNSTDPNEDKSLAGKFLNESALISALDPYDPYKSAFEAAYGIAKVIANNHVFLNGNKRTATQTVIKICTDNGFNFNGNNAALIELVNSLVTEDKDDYDDEKAEKNFIRGISELFTL